MKPRSIVLFLLLPFATACGDASKDEAGSEGGMGGSAAIVDAGFDAGGGKGMTVSTGGVMTFSSIPPAPDAWTCENAPRYGLVVPDAGEDACLACALEHCCEEPFIGCFVWQHSQLNYCYDEMFSAVRDCFARKLDAGSSEEAWYVVANCFLELDPWQADTPYAIDPDDPRLGSASASWGAAASLAECVIGPRPASYADGGGSLGADDDAGGSARGQGPPYSPPVCAEECFAGWQQ